MRSRNHIKYLISDAMLFVYLSFEKVVGTRANLYYLLWHKLIHERKVNPETSFASYLRSRTWSVCITAFPLAAAAYPTSEGATNVWPIAIAWNLFFEGYERISSLWTRQYSRMHGNEKRKLLIVRWVQKNASEVGCT